jgi:hypothetical protein
LTTDYAILRVLKSPKNAELIRAHTKPSAC